jgi:hypothetical protein
LDTAIGENYAREKQRNKKIFNEEEKEQRFKEEVDWKAYFESIKHLCPWSLRAYMQDKILHVTTSGGCELTWCAMFDKSKHEALLFEYPHETSIDTLVAITEKIEKKYKGLIAFWSHPEEKDQNTPKPCVICQDRELLTDLRKKIGFEDE